MKSKRKLIGHIQKIKQWQLSTQLSFLLFVILLISLPLFVLSLQQQTQTKQFAQQGDQCGGPGAPYHCESCSNPDGTLHGVCGKLCCVPNDDSGGGGTCPNGVQSYSCTYSQSDGKCYGGTGTTGFNQPNCKYVCGPVACPGSAPLPVKPPDNGAGCPRNGDTCTYKESNGQCYSGTGANGFNVANCKYSCGPVQCPDGPPVKVQPPGQPGARCTYSDPKGCFEGTCKAGTPCKQGSFNEGCGYDAALGVLQIDCNTGAPINRRPPPPPASGGGAAPVANPGGGSAPIGGGSGGIGGGAPGGSSGGGVGAPGSCSFTEDGINGGKVYSGRCQVSTSATCPAGYVLPNLIPVAGVGQIGNPTCPGTNLICCPAYPGNPCKYGTNCPKALSTIASLAGIGNGQADNKNPQKKTVTASFYAYNMLPIEAETKPIVATGTLIYDPATGTYTNQNFPSPITPDGQYTLLIYINNYLTRKAVGTNNSTVFSLPGKNIILKELTFIPGDIAPAPKGDNYIDVEDYNKMLGCFGKAPTDDCSVADLNSNGSIEQNDVDLLLEHFGAVGDVPNNEVAKFTCVMDPLCEKTNYDTLQMCALKCSIHTSVGLP